MTRHEELRRAVHYLLHSYHDQLSDGDVEGVKARIQKSLLALEELCGLSMPKLHKRVEAQREEEAEDLRKASAFHEPYYD